MPIVIRTPDDITQLRSNTFLGTLPQMKNSTITFADHAKGNVIFCEPGVTLVNSSLQIQGNNALIYLSSSRSRYLVTASIYNDNVLYFGRNNSFTSTLHIIMSEQKHVFFGDDCMFSIDVWVRNADPHLIYSCETNARLNPSRSVFVGDHVWLGQEVRLLKGTQIDSGSIIGGGSIIAGKRVHSNSSWAGNPSHCLKEGIFWDRTCVHNFLQDDTQRSQDWNTWREDIPADAYTFSHDAQQYLPFETLEEIFSTASMDEKLDYLKHLSHQKNRFVRPTERKKLFGISWK